MQRGNVESFPQPTSPVTKVTASSLGTKHIPQQPRGDDSSITFATIG